MELSGLKKYCDKWNLFDPKLIASTLTSDVFRVKIQDSDAVLKILNKKGQRFESKGALVLRCFDGNGAVKLLNSDEGAHLLEFVDGQHLKGLVAAGNDNLATEIICGVVARLHSYSGPIPDGLISMQRNFRSLFEKAQRENCDSIYLEGAMLAESLIETEREVRVLHGDIHHENILQSSLRGWLVIDPQCLFGERTYDLANTFYNPTGFLEFAVSSETINQRSMIFSKRFKVDQRRILEFAFAYGCLSAAWCIEDGQEEVSTLRIARSIRQILGELQI